MSTFYAVLLPVLVLFCGLSVDVGTLELKQLKMQSAADAAAISAELEAERDTGNWVTVAQEEAAAHGFTNGSNNVTVSVAQQPSSGPYAGRYDALQATISQRVKTFFMGAINGGYVTISAQGSALITPCVFLTGTGTLQQYTLDGVTGDFKGSTCPFDINTNVETTNDNVVPEALNIAGPSSNSSIAGYEYPPPNYNAPAVTDPLSYVTEPTFSGTCNHTSYSLYNVSSNTTLNPGTYCKGLNITNSTATLNPGLYVITGGGTWYNSTVTGTGVTLFFTSGGGASDGKFILSESTVTLSAPTSASNGSLAGILIFTDRTWTHTNPQDVDVTQTTFTGDGIWYLPSTGLWVYNSSTMHATNYFGLVADNLTASGTSIQMLNNYSGLPGGNPMRRQAPLVQ
jgi:Flp pilus assembly protein TadG